MLPITELLSNYRIADIQPHSEDPSVVQIFVESLDNGDLISCVLEIPSESVHKYDLKGFVHS